MATFVLMTSCDLKSVGLSYRNLVALELRKRRGVSLRLGTISLQSSNGISRELSFICIIRGMQAVKDTTWM